MEHFQEVIRQLSEKIGVINRKLTKGGFRNSQNYPQEACLTTFGDLSTKLAFSFKSFKTLKTFKALNAYKYLKKLKEKKLFLKKGDFLKSLLIKTLLILFCFLPNLGASETLTASWYSTQSLKTEGTYKYSKGVMANGKKFNDNSLTCATRLYPLGSRLRITNLESGETVIVKVTDRIGKRFAQTRIDLSKRAFRQIASLKRGLISVRIERIK